MNKNPTLSALTLSLSLAVASCGGGSQQAAPVVPPTQGLTNAQRATAATTTAQNNALCAPILPFYWEVGDQSGALVSGSQGRDPTGALITATTMMNIASASKWPFAAYVIQKYGDVAGNVPYLNFTSGYSNFNNAQCTTSRTVAECNNGIPNATEVAALANGLPIFHYEGGHMQQLAAASTLLGLGALDIVGLATEVNTYLGSDVGLTYVTPQPPGGVRTTASSYAVFLRKLLATSPAPLQIGNLLDAHAVCTQAKAGCMAVPNQIPDNFHYSLGHWVEDDPATTPSYNFAYSSAGALGFYPWVDFDRTLYGIIARQDPSVSGETEGTGDGYSSLKCGRLIRLAWKTGVAQ